MLKALNLIPVLFMLIGTNILLSTYNSVARRHEVFSKKFLMDGIFKGLLFTGGLLALAYVLDIVEISGGFELTPAAILEAAMLFYAAKIAMTLKDLIMSFDKVVIFEECAEPEKPEDRTEQVQELDSEEIEEHGKWYISNEILEPEEYSEVSEETEDLEQIDYGEETEKINNVFGNTQLGRLFVSEIEAD